MFKRLSLICLCLFLLNVVAFGQQERKSFHIEYRTGSTKLDPNYKENANTLKELNDYLNKLSSDKTHIITGITIYGATSLEGSYENNHKIAFRRRDALKEVVTGNNLVPESNIILSNQYLPISDIAVSLQQSGKDTDGKIQSILKEDSTLVYYSTRKHDGKRLTIDRRVLRLAHHNQGSTWRYLEKYVFPKLRYASIEIVSERKSTNLTPLQKVQIPEISVGCSDTTSIDTETKPQTYNPPPQPPKKQTRSQSQFTIKTNGIGWMMLVGNVAAEYKFTDKLSINIPFYYSGGYNYFVNNIKFRGIVIQPELRYHFEKVPGLFAGIHGGVGWYNVAAGGNYRYQDASGKRPAIGGGLGIGYKLQFENAPGWGIEFSVGAGAYDIRYDKFYNEPNGPCVETNVHDVFVGIDNVSVSITYDLTKKGGKR